MIATPVCGQIKRDTNGSHHCGRTWFHEGDHIARDGVRWAAAAGWLTGRAWAT